MSGGQHHGHDGAGRVVDGRFELLERLGSGGMGTVWRARDTVLDREVALKEVRPPHPVSPDPADEDTASRRLRERVLREARALARLNHPHVVTVHHVVDSRPHPWIVMELLPGRSLQDRLADGPLEPGEAARIGREILAALRAAHAAGIHHRDVKPANVLLRENGSAVLTDFGIAAVQGSTSLTATGELVGSPEYIAPERIRGTGDDPASDLWSLAMTLYVCTEGASPLRRPTALATLAAVLDEPIPPPVRSGALAPALTAMLVRDPAARPDAERFDALLADAEAGRGGAPFPAARPTTPLPAPPYASSYAPTLPAGPRPVPAPGDGSGSGTVPAAPERPARRRGRAALVAGAAVAAVLVAASAYALTAFSGGGDGGGENRGGKRSSTPAASPTSARSSSARSPSPSPSSSSPASPGPSVSPTPTASAPSGPSASPAPSATAAVPGEESVGTWIAQIFSEPVSSGTAARDKRLAAVRAEVPEARMLRSDDFASLRPGYWVIYAPGPFADGHAAVRFCADRGRTDSNTCMGRYLSHRASDRVYLCAPASGGPTGSGRCTRP